MDCLFEARQARLRFPIKNKIIYPYAYPRVARFISNEMMDVANQKRVGHLFAYELPFLSGDATCHYPVVVITRVITLMLTTEREREIYTIKAVF